MVFMRGIVHNWKKGLFRQFSISSVRNSAYDGEGKTTVTVLNKQGDLGVMIDGYSQQGFRLNNGMFVRGPMVLFPRTALCWNVEGDCDIHENSLKLFTIIEPKLDLVVVGFGKTPKPLDLKRLHNFRMKRKLNIEVLPVDKAAATFNYLSAEGRWVAGAFIPPYALKMSEEEALSISAGKKETYKTDSSYIF